MTLNSFCASVVLGCSALRGRGLAACFLGLFSAHGSERILPQTDVGLFRHSTPVLQPRRSPRGAGAGAEGLTRAILWQFFNRVIWKCHSSCATAVCSREKREEKESQQQCGTATKHSDEFILYHLRTIFQNCCNICLPGN